MNVHGKKLIRIRLNEQNVLNPREMKDVKGGSTGSWCNVSGEWVGPITNCSDAGCERLYGSGATCE